MFVPIKDLIGDLTKELGLNQRAALQAIAVDYAKAVPPKILEATRITTLRNGVLEIEVFAAPLLMELRQYLQKQILKQLQASHPNVRDVRFVPSRS